MLKQAQLLLLTILLVLLALPAFGAEGQAQEPQMKETAPGGRAEEHVFLTKGYRYDPAGPNEDKDLGLFLCGTRCNALSVDYLNITSPGGWRMIRVAKDREKVISLKNMGLDGSCVCTGDDYLVKINDIYMSK